MVSRKLLFSFVLILGLLYATNVRVSDLEYPTTLKVNQSTIFNLTINYNFDDSGCYRARVYLKGDTTQLNSPNQECVLGSSIGNTKWSTRLSAKLFEEPGVKTFVYIVEYSTADSSGYIQCPLANNCNKQLNITVVADALPVTTLPRNNTGTGGSSGSNSGNTGNTGSTSTITTNSSNATGTNGNSGSSDSTGGTSGTGAPLTADQIRALLNSQKNTTGSENTTTASKPVSGFDFGTITSNTLFWPAVGGTCCITLLIIAVIAGVVWYTRFRKPRMPRSRRRPLAVDIEDDTQ